MNRKDYAKFAKQATDIAIKNSEIVQPYVKPTHYRRGLFVLNVLNLLLKNLSK